MQLMQFRGGLPIFAVFDGLRFLGDEIRFHPGELAHEVFHHRHEIAFDREMRERLHADDLREVPQESLA